MWVMVNLLRNLIIYSDMDDLDIQILNINCLIIIYKQQMFSQGKQDRIIATSILYNAQFFIQYRQIIIFEQKKNKQHMQSSNPSPNSNANPMRIKLTNNTNVKQPTTYNSDANHNTNSNKDASREDPPKETLDIRARIQQKLAMRGFKSLNRKTIQSPTTHIHHNETEKDKEPASKNNSQINKQNVNTNTMGQVSTANNIVGRYCHPNQNSSTQSNTTNNAYYNFNSVIKANQASNRKLKDIQNYLGQDKQNKQIKTFNKVSAYNYPTSQNAFNKIQLDANPRQNRKYSSSKEKRQKRQRQKQEEYKINKNSNAQMQVQNTQVSIKNKSYHVNVNNHKRSKSNLSACSVVKNKSVHKSNHKGQSEYQYRKDQTNQVVPLSININLENKDKQKQMDRQKSKSKRINLKQKNNIESSPASNTAYTYNYNDKQTFSVYNHKYASNKAYNSNTKTEQQVTNNNTTISSFRSPTKCGYVLPCTGSILCQTMSKDGNYKIISRSLAVEQLKEAVELQYNINLKSKKQSIKEMQKLQNTQNSTSNMLNVTDQSQNITPSPRNSNFNNQNAKYTLDPSKVSNKQNGNVKAYAVNSNQGISRKYNEDRVSIILNITKNGVKASYFAIYDGHGGSNCCDFLTQNLHQFIFNSKYFPTQPRQALLEGIKIAQNKFIENVKNIYRDKKQLDRSGSCAIILLVVGDDCYIANLGDSRAVMSTCYGKPMYSLSRDHKPTDSGQQARILKQGGKIYRTQMIKIKKDGENKKEQENKGSNNSNEVIIGPLRVYPGKLSVTRTFGDIQAKEAEFGGIKNCISIDPEICKYSLTGKQDFIILGCDGLFQKLDSQQVIEQVWKTVKKNKTSTIHEVVGVAAQEVVKLCMDRKGTDNITTILVCLGSLGLGTNLNEYASV